MGLRMDDLHTPSVAAGRSPNATSNGTPEDQLSLMDLIAEKDRIEGELSALGSVLDSHGVNMNTSLTTFDGYPRDDIDIAQIRTTRARIIHLRNDHKSLMSRIEVGLHAHHASAAAQASTILRATTASSSTGTSTQNPTIDVPFARVNSVVPGSPAEAAGLKAGDSILRFGSANFMNHEKLAKVAEVVSQNEGRPIAVKISRPSNGAQSTGEVQLQLTPRSNWGGRGMLGCHLLPM